MYEFLTNDEISQLTDFFLEKENITTTLDVSSSIEFSDLTLCRLELGTTISYSTLKSKMFDIGYLADKCLDLIPE